MPAPEYRIRPVTAEDVTKAIRRVGWSAYLYLGEEDDAGWQNALAIDDDPGFPRLRVYRVVDRDEVDCWSHGVTSGALLVTDKGDFSWHIPRERTESLVEVILAIAEILGGEA